jgi:hypothetical protein
MDIRQATYRHMSAADKETVGLHTCPKCGHLRKAYPFDHFCPGTDGPAETARQDIRQTFDDELEREWYDDRPGTGLLGG